MEKQAKLIVIGLLVFVISSATLTYWLIFRTPPRASAPPANAASGSATPAESVDWNKLYYEPAPGQASGQQADSFTITNAAGSQ